MSEPHQRTQSGKLRNSSKFNKSSSNTIQQEKPEQYPGINNAMKLEYSHVDDNAQNYYQTPTVLTDIHVSILQRIADGFHIKDSIAIDKNWRRTWNIGTWMIQNKLCISINIMQPSISQSWTDIDGSMIDVETVHKYASYFTSLNLPNSSCRVSGTNNIKLQGRWTLHVIDKLINDKLIAMDDIKFSSINIGNTRLFCWIKFNSTSEYMCTFTFQTIDVLINYLPNWCRYINEVSSGSGTSLRLINPDKPNDSLHLTIDPYGYIRYNGKIDNLTRLTEALYIAIHSTINSKRLKLFLESLEYKKV